MYNAKGKYLQTAEAYQAIIDKVHGKPLLNEHFWAGYSYYNEFLFVQAPAYRKTHAVKPDSTLLVKADTLLSQYERAVTAPVVQALTTRAYIADYKDTLYSDLKGVAKPRYEKIIEVLGAKPTPTALEKKALSNAYAYLGNYAQYHDKDDAKAMENFTKSRELNPDNGYAKFYFDQKAAPPTPPATPAKPKKAGTK